MPDYHELAIKYFQGEISAREESILYAWVREDETNLAALHAWEEEWKKVDSDEMSEKWARLAGHLAAREVLEDAGMRMSKRPFRPGYYIAAAAAAILIAMPFVFHREVNPQTYTMEAPAGEKCKVLLPDSSAVWLNSGSRLSFNDGFNRGNRSVTLTGEGYFDISRNEAVPFIVNCGKASVLVHGTKFNVSAYPEERFIETSVIEGKVSFIHGQARMDLVRGQSAKFDLLSEVFSRSAGDPRDATAWTESRFAYSDITLGELAEKLSRTYAVRFHFNTTEHINDRFSISLRNNETLNDVLKALERIIRVKARVEGDNVYIDRK